MTHREIRVRPVVRYIVTDFTCDDDMRNQKSIEFGEFDNVDRANVVAYSLAVAEADAAGTSTQDLHVIVEPARKLRIDWLRGLGEPQEAIRWERSEVTERTSNHPETP